MGHGPSRGSEWLHAQEHGRCARAGAGGGGAQAVVGEEGEWDRAHTPLRRS